MSNLKLFQDKQIRAQWDAEAEDWLFSVVDVVGVLTDSSNPTDYLKKMRKRDVLLGEYIGTNCPHVDMLTETGKTRKTLAANTKQLLRIIQSIPSAKAEPFKMWLAQVGSDRLDEIADPEKAIRRGADFYRAKGYTEGWINQRLQTIEMRNELEDEWKARGVKSGKEYAILTDEMTKAWSGLTVRQYKELKDLKKENLRDNMTNIELVLNMLAEVTTTGISKAEQPTTLEESKAVARSGGGIAKNARLEYEQRIKQSVISPLNAAHKELLEISDEAAEDTDPEE